MKISDTHRQIQQKRLRQIQPALANDPIRWSIWAVLMAVWLFLALWLIGCSDNPTAPTTTVSQPCVTVHHDPVCALELTTGGLLLVCKPAYDETVCR